MAEHDHRRMHSCPVIGGIHRSLTREGDASDINDLNKELIHTGPDTYSLAQVARMFRSSPTKMKQRAMDGEFPYQVNAFGRFVFPKEALLDHLDELIRKNNRID